MEDLQYLHNYFDQVKQDRIIKTSVPEKIVIYSNETKILDSLRKYFFKFFDIPIIHFVVNEEGNKLVIEENVIKDSIVMIDLEIISNINLSEFIRKMSKISNVKNLIVLQKEILSGLPKGPYYLIKKDDVFVRVMNICKYLLKVGKVDEKNTKQFLQELDLPEFGLDLKNFISMIEIQLIEQALGRTGGNKKKASQLLSLNRTTLIEKMKKLGLL